MYEVSDSVTSVNRRVTLSDVAKAAHVATSTASRALHRPGRVNAETEALVRQVATDLGYERPEALWLSAHRATQKIGAMIVPERYRLIAAIHEQLDLQQYLPVLYSSACDRALQIVKQEFNNVDGMLIDNPQIPGRICLDIPSAQPLVVTNCRIDQASCVIPDTEQGVATLLTHLKSLRHVSLSYFYAKDWWLDESVLQALRSGCEQFRLTLHTLGNVGDSLEAGARAVSAWRKHLDSAVVFCGSFSAIGFIQELSRSLKMAVPDEVSVVAIGDAFTGNLFQPKVTTLEVPYREIGVEAVRELLGQIRHRVRGYKQVKRIKMRLENGGTTGYS